ncbi:hypothetical protein ACJ73_09856 [Blastomyces percursus]|uniref:Uncharacterized protein n=1 Tax=Blastomyces percursus TaxID=1658174 RepID=A0A1J9Q537_9EURO|nr:hypothetical protein ACJ73_09856 [Blastomyces percursus]
MSRTTRTVTSSVTLPVVWLYGEKIQLRRHYVGFNVQALKECAYRELGGRCVGISKPPDEGLYNALSLDHLPSSKQKAGARFVIGPTTERAFFIDGYHGQEIDQSPMHVLIQTYLPPVNFRIGAWAKLSISI